MEKKYLHVAVLLKETIESLNIKPNGIYIDGTFGRGGHSKVILSKLNTYGKLFVIDRDIEAIKEAININDNRMTIIHGTFSKMENYMKERNLIGKINGILLDLGVSSPQIDNPNRGFSFMHDGLIDMRMDTKNGQSAAQWINKASIYDIAFVLKTFGEERFNKKIAKAIFFQNKKKPITNTKELARIITSVKPFNNRNKHPATRSFQAIRIYINQELEEIKKVLKSILTILAPKGRISIISFHSLEDRLIKNFIRDNSCKLEIPSYLPITEIQIKKYFQKKNQLKLIGKIKPSNKEIKNNPRSRSSILRFSEKL